VRSLSRLLLFGATALGFAFAASPSYASGQPGILINGDTGFPACRCTTGIGTTSNPYVIGPFAITSANTQGSAITIENTTKDFVITGISANYTNTDPTEAVIHLSGVTGPATVNNVSANGDGIGIKIDNYSSNIALNSISVNKMNGAGLDIENSGDISTANSKYKATSDEVPFHHADGLYAYDSWDLQIGGAAKCPQGVCNTFDYDSGWGVYLQGTTNVTIDQASANADDNGGYILDGASNTTIENSSAEAGGPICISLNGGKEPSGYFDTGLMANLMLINGAHDNTIENGTFNGFAPASGFDIAGIPNQKYFNVCTGASSPTFVPSGTAMGSGNTFSNLCYNTSNQVPGLPPSTCKS
jgi:hypothetical protein